MKRGFYLDLGFYSARSTVCNKNYLGKEERNSLCRIIRGTGHCSFSRNINRETAEKFCRSYEIFFTVRIMSVVISDNVESPGPPYAMVAVLLLYIFPRGG